MGLLNTAFQFKVKAGGSGDCRSQITEQMLTQKYQSSSVLQSKLADTRIINGTHQHVFRENEANRELEESIQLIRSLELFGNLFHLGVIAKSERYWAPRILAGRLSLLTASFTLGNFFFPLQVFSVQFCRQGQDFWKK